MGEMWGGRLPRWLAWTALAMLMAGFALGLIAHERGTWGPLVEALRPIGSLWTNLLRVVSIPLTLCLLIVGLATLKRGEDAGKWASVTLIVMFALLTVAALIAIGGSYAFLSLVEVPPLREPVAQPSSVTEITAADWLQALIPKNAFAAAAEEDLVGLLVLAALFGVALQRIAPERRQSVLSVFEGVRDALLVIVHWALLAMPLGAFALAFTMTADSGWNMVGAAGSYLALACGLLVLFASILYPLAIMFGRVRPLAFGSAVAPAQVVAMGSRSSIASLPAMISGAERLELPHEAREISLPLTVTLFKLNRPITSLSKLILLAALFHVPLHVGTFVVFSLTVFALSMATPGVPRAGGGSTTGAYLAAGLPIEAIMLFEALTPITDVFRTLLNVTGDFAVAVISSRWLGGKS